MYSVTHRALFLAHVNLPGFQISLEQLSSEGWLSDPRCLVALPSGIIPKKNLLVDMEKKGQYGKLHTHSSILPAWSFCKLPITFHWSKQDMWPCLTSRRWRSAILLNAYWAKRMRILVRNSSVYHLLKWIKSEVHWINEDTDKWVTIWKNTERIQTHHGAWTIQNKQVIRITSWLLT